MSLTLLQPLQMPRPPRPEDLSSDPREALKGLSKWAASLSSVLNTFVQQVQEVGEAFITAPSSANLDTGVIQGYQLIVTSALITVAAQIQDAIITNAKIVDATIQNAKIADATITGAKIVNATITGSLIATRTITGGTAGNISTTTITGGEIVTGTITTTQIAAATIVAGNIAAGTITAAQIAAATITTNEIAANTIVAGNIAAGTITGAKIATRTITGGTAGNISTTTITGGEIVTGTITATQIAAATITADKLSVAQLSAIAADMGTLNAGTINGGKIISGATSGAHTKMGPTGVQVFDSAGNVIASLSTGTNSLNISSGGNLALQMVSNVPAELIFLDSSGAAVGRISGFQSLGQNWFSWQSDVDQTGNLLLGKSGQKWAGQYRYAGSSISDFINPGGVTVQRMLLNTSQALIGSSTAYLNLTSAEIQANADFRPVTNNTANLGNANARWFQVWLNSGSLNVIGAATQASAIAAGLVSVPTAATGTLSILVDGVERRIPFYPQG